MLGLSASRFESAWAAIQASQQSPPVISRKGHSLCAGSTQDDAVPVPYSDDLSLSEMDCGQEQPHDAVHASISLPARIGDSSSDDASSKAQQLQLCHPGPPGSRNSRAYTTHGKKGQAMLSLGRRSCVVHSSDSDAHCTVIMQQPVLLAERHVQQRRSFGPEIGRRHVHQQQQQESERLSPEPHSTGLQPGLQYQKSHKQHYTHAARGPHGPECAAHNTGKHRIARHLRMSPSKFHKQQPKSSKARAESVSTRVRARAETSGHELQLNPVYSPEAPTGGLQLENGAGHGSHTHKINTTDRQVADIESKRSQSASDSNGDKHGVHDNAMFGSPWSSVGSDSEMEDLRAQALHMQRC